MDNLADQGPAIYTGGQQSVLVTNSVIAGNFGSAGPEIVSSVEAAHALIGDDAGDSRAVPTGSGFSEPTFDQRGASFSRVSGPGLDIGAHEVQIAPPPPPPNTDGGGGGSTSIWLLGLLSLALVRRVTVLRLDRR